jgi:hypothetical protein
MNFCQFFTWRLAKCSNENALGFHPRVLTWPRPSYITVACKFVISISNARGWKPYEKTKFGDAQQNILMPRNDS